MMKYDGKSIFQLKPQRLQRVLSNKHRCLNCGKAITYSVSNTRFCLECCLKFSLQIRAMNEKIRKALALMEGYTQ